MKRKKIERKLIKAWLERNVKKAIDLQHKLLRKNLKKGSK